ncbi:hypothetical protein [Stenotrophomonas sp. YIM B06876]|uniref:hypothetical protein n=1 Tax=Stenotrophomonas sp. YIM B06876 TaxID=3060211 RepID=UPI0027398BCC|nr:hypothetical protein [Stenotrophomonas sp. YIM B06876]
MNEIIERWKALEDLDREHELFDAYTKSREAYLAEVRARAKSQGSSSSLESLYVAERRAFSAYLEHRLKVKPE